ncbi:hypothetical protein ACFLKA_07205 [Clostridium caseinilyticum]|nr:hypothetical protein [Clostridium sporogenes]
MTLSTLILVGGITCCSTSKNTITNKENSKTEQSDNKSLKLDFV